MENKVILKLIHFMEMQSVWLRRKSYLQISDTFSALQIKSGQILRTVCLGLFFSTTNVTLLTSNLESSEGH